VSTLFPCVIGNSKILVLWISAQHPAQASNPSGHRPRLRLIKALALLVLVIDSIHHTYTCYEVLSVINYSNLFLFISFIFLLFNGSAFGFIFYLERLGDSFGLILFCGTSLLGALCSFFASEKKATFYAKLLFYCNLVVTFLPLYYWGISRLLFSI
jgi:hypothetical protein